MLSASVHGIRSQFDRVVVVALSEHATLYASSIEQIMNNLFEEFNFKPEIYFIKETRNQPMTVVEGISQANVFKVIEGQIVVKDCDNYFSLPKEIKGNCVIYANLEDYQGIDAYNKSYISMNSLGVVTTIVEKQVISGSFCVGYAFDDFQTILSAWKASSVEDYHMSHLIYNSMLKYSIDYIGVKCQDYLDWGTQQEWDRYTEQFGTIVLDIDGVLCYNSAPDYSPYHNETKWLEKNAEYLRRIDYRKLTIILTTSRPEYCRTETVDKLIDSNIPFDYLIMGLPHAKRILVNDRLPGSVDTAASFNLDRDVDGQLITALKSIGIKEI